MSHRSIQMALMLSLTLVAGCKLPSHGLADTSAGVATPTGVLATQPGPGAAGLADVRIQLRVERSGLPAFSVMSLPGQWSEALLSLHSSSANTPYDPVHHQRSIAFDPSHLSGTDPGTSLLAGTDLNAPLGVAVSTDGTVYVADTYNDRIRRIASGTVDIYAGIENTAGSSVDGSGLTEATFYRPTHIAVDGAGALYVVEGTSSSVRKIAADANHTVSTVLSQADNSDISLITGLTVAPDGGVYICYDSSAYGTSVLARLDSPHSLTNLAAGLPPLGRGLAADGLGHFYYVSEFENQVVKVTPTADVANPTIGLFTDGMPGEDDAAPSFNGPSGLAADTAGNVYVADSANHLIRKIDASGVVTTVAGDKANNDLGGYAENSDPLLARFNFPSALAVGTDGTLIVADTDNNSIRAVKAGSQLYASDVAFPPLRPAADYQGHVYLRNLSGAIQTLRLAGSAYQSGVTLNAGANVVTFTVTPNGDEANYGVQGGSSFFAGDTVTLQTGIAANQPGVSRVRIVLSGDANFGATTEIAELTDPATWSTFTWNTATAGLMPGTGRIDVFADDPHHDPVGHAAFAITIN